MGTVYRDKRPDREHSWYVDYTGLDGKRKREYAGSGKREAEKILVQLEAEVIEANRLGAEKVKRVKAITFEDFVTNEYLPYCEKHHGVNSYRNDKTRASVAIARGPASLRMGRQRFRLGRGRVFNAVDLVQPLPLLHRSDELPPVDGLEGRVSWGPVRVGLHAAPRRRAADTDAVGEP